MLDLVFATATFHDRSKTPFFIAAGVLVAWRAARLPVMSSRYDAPAVASAGRPGQPTAPPAAARPAATGPARPGRSDSATMWESLSRGEDPT